MNAALNNTKNKIHWKTFFFLNCKIPIYFNHLTTISYTPSFSHSKAQPWPGMLSLRLGGIVVQSQIPTKFVPAQPESNMKRVNIKNEFHVHHAIFRQAPCSVSKKSFKKLNNFGFFTKIHFWHIFYRRPNKLWVKGWCTCSLQCFVHICNPAFNICHCPVPFWNFCCCCCCCCFEKVG